MLIQVTDDLATSREREIRGLLSAMKELGLNEGYVLTYDDYEDISIDGCRIYVRPVYEFLLYDRVSSKFPHSNNRQSFRSRSAPAITPCSARSYFLHFHLVEPNVELNPSRSTFLQ